MNISCKREINDYSIVLVADFKPKEFSVKWLRMNKFLSKDSLDDFFCKKENYTYSDDFTCFDLDNVNVSIYKNKIIFLSKIIGNDEEFLKTVELFCSKIDHYYIKCYGYNYDAHYYCDKEEDFNMIYDSILPFNKFDFDSRDFDEAEKQKRFALPSLNAARKKDGDEGQYNITIAKEYDDFNERFSFYVRCNDHSNILSNLETDHRASILINKIKKDFSIEMSYMKKIHDNFIPGGKIDEF